MRKIITPANAKSKREIIEILVKCRKCNKKNFVLLVEQMLRKYDKLKKKKKKKRLDKAWEAFWNYAYAI